MTHVDETFRSRLNSFIRGGLDAPKRMRVASQLRTVRKTGEFPRSKRTLRQDMLALGGLSNAHATHESDIAVISPQIRRVAGSLKIPSRLLRQFAKGFEVEKEHKDVTKGDPVKTGKIARAHLKELPDYYTRLNKMEKNESRRDAARMRAIARQAQHAKDVPPGMMDKLAPGNTPQERNANARERIRKGLKRPPTVESARTPSRRQIAYRERMKADLERKKSAHAKAKAYFNKSSKSCCSSTLAARIHAFINEINYEKHLKRMPNYPGTEPNPDWKKGDDPDDRTRLTRTRSGKPLAITALRVYAKLDGRAHPISRYNKDNPKYRPSRAGQKYADAEGASRVVGRGDVMKHTPFTHPKQNLNLVNGKKTK